MLDGAGINDVAAFLRGLNLLDNAREATRLIDEALRKPAGEAINRARDAQPAQGPSQSAAKAPAAKASQP